MNLLAKQITDFKHYLIFAKCTPVRNAAVSRFYTAEVHQKSVFPRRILIGALKYVSKN